jgi:hypothetical protein
MNPRHSPSEDAANARLRAAFQARRSRTTEGGIHPPAEELWAAVRGERSASVRHTLIAHTAACAACAEAWRMAAAVSPGDVAAAAHAARPAWTAFRGYAALAAAAALVVALGAGLWLRGPAERAPEPGFRGAPETAVRSLLAESEALPREDFRLRWSAAPAGSRYDVRVTTESLEVVADVQRLSEPYYVIPAAALSSVPAGGRLLWRVEVTLPDGSRAASQTYVTRLGP